jgi:hypothetical protein
MVRETGNLRITRRFQSVRVGVTIVADARCLSLICSFLQPHQARSADCLDSKLCRTGIELRPIGCVSIGATGLPGRVLCQEQGKRGSFGILMIIMVSTAWEGGASSFSLDLSPHLVVYCTIYHNLCSMCNTPE